MVLLFMVILIDNNLTIGSIVDIDIPDNHMVKAGQSVVIIPK